MCPSSPKAWGTYMLQSCKFVLQRIGRSIFLNSFTKFRVSYSHSCFPATPGQLFATLTPNLPSFTSLCHCLLRVSLSRLVFPPQVGDGGKKGWGDVDGGCVELFCPWGVSSANPVPQINSQPASRALTSSLFLSLPPFLSLSISLSFPARGTHCPHVSVLHQLPARYQQCMSVWRPLWLPVSPPPVRLSVCMGVWLSVHLPVSLPAAHSSQYLFTGKPPGCQPLCQSARLPACLFVICLRLYLFVCLSICLLTCLPVHLYLFCLLACLTIETPCRKVNTNPWPHSIIHRTYFNFSFKKTV